MKDKKDINIWSELWSIIKKKKKELIVLATPYVLELEGKKKFMHIIEWLKVHQLDIQIPSRK